MPIADVDRGPHQLPTASAEHPRPHQTASLRPSMVQAPQPSDYPVHAKPAPSGRVVAHTTQQECRPVVDGQAEYAAAAADSLGSSFFEKPNQTPHRAGTVVLTRPPRPGDGPIQRSVPYVSSTEA